MRYSGDENWRERIGFFIAGDMAFIASSIHVSLGCTNNLIYVVILSAALDIVGASIPKGVVLLADITPALIVKLILPYVIDRVPYAFRIGTCIVTSFLAMQLISTSSSLFTSLVGICLASASSGLGELTWLMLTTKYRSTEAIGFWGSGTGMAGVLGAGMYLVLTTWWGVGMTSALAFFSMLPGLMGVAYFMLLGPFRDKPEEEILDSPDGLPSITDGAVLIRSDVHSDADTDERACRRSRHRRSLTPDIEDPYAPVVTTTAMRGDRYEPVPVNDTMTIMRTIGWREKVDIAKGLITPYMLPMFIVYAAYVAFACRPITIELESTQSIKAWHPRCYFQSLKPLFLNFMYVTYQALYQIGVFLSRSSLSYVSLNHLLLPSLLQLANLALLTCQSLLQFPFPTIYPLFAIIFYEGILGGLVYVNCFHLISKRTPKETREFSMGVVGLADSLGILIAGVISLWLESALCHWQVDHGRTLCLHVDLAP